MRVLFVSEGLPFPPVGGGLLRSYHLIRALAKHHEITVVGFTYGEEIEAPPFPVRVIGVPWDWPVLYRQMHYGDDEAAALAAEILEQKSEEPWLASFYDCPAMEETIGLLAEDGFDLVVFEGTDMARFLPLFPASVPTVIDFMDVHSLMAIRETEEQVGAERLRAEREARRVIAFERRIAGRCVLRIACSEREAEAARACLDIGDVTVVPNGVDTAFFEPCDEPDTEGYLLFTGSMSYAPNVEAVEHFVANILPRILREIPACRFHIVGDKPVEAVQRLASPMITVHGRVPDMRPYFRKAAVVVVPLLSGGGTRLKILEAAASGKAVVTTSLGVEGLNFRSQEDLLVADSPDQFANAVVRLATDVRERRRMGRQARAAATQYDWDGIGSRFCRAIGSHL